MDVRADMRAAYIARIGNLPVSLTIPSIYPRMFGIHNMRKGDGLPVTETLDDKQASDVDHTRIRLPAGLWPSAEQMEPEGVYLLVTGDVLYLYIGKATPPDIIQQLFNVKVKSAEELPPVRWPRRCSLLKYLLISPLGADHSYQAARQ